MSQRSDITNADQFYVGEDRFILFTVYDSNDENTRQVVDISLWTFQFRLRKRGGSTNLISKSLGSGIAITNGPQGLVTVTLDAADTSSFLDGTYEYTLWATDNNSKTVTLATGLVILQPPVPA